MTNKPWLTSIFIVLAVVGGQLADCHQSSMLGDKLADSISVANQGRARLEGKIDVYHREEMKTGARIAGRSELIRSHEKRYETVRIIPLSPDSSYLYLKAEASSE